MRGKAIPEIKNYLSQVEIELGNSDIYLNYTERESVSIIIDLFKEIFLMVYTKRAILLYI